MGKRTKRIKPLSPEMKKVVWAKSKENAGEGWRDPELPDEDRPIIAGQILPTKGCDDV